MPNRNKSKVRVLNRHKCTHLVMAIAIVTFIVMAIATAKVTAIAMHLPCKRSIRLL
ncbi:hypothetical protein GCM10027566_25300 [Arachidicoccus ginsenosidivorans]